MTAAATNTARPHRQTRRTRTTTPTLALIARWNLHSRSSVPIYPNFTPKQCRYTPAQPSFSRPHRTAPLVSLPASAPQSP